VGRLLTVDPADLPGWVDWRRCIRLGLLGAAFTLVLVVLAVVASPEPIAGGTVGGFTRPYTPPRDRFEVMLNHADGQAYATLAQDPTLSRPDAFVEGGPQAAHFGARPVLPYLLWGASFGRPGWILGAYLAVEALAVGIAVAGAAALLHALGRRSEDRLAVAMLLLPGMVLGVVLLGQDVLAVGLVLLGLVLWLGRRPAPAAGIAVFTLAGLTRETMLIVVAVVAIRAGWRRMLGRRDLLLLVPFGCYLLWGAFSSHRVGASTGGGVESNLALPFAGIAGAVGQWGVLGVVVMAALVALVVVAVIRRTSNLLTWLVVAFTVALAFSAKAVWWSWETGLRVALPLQVFALLDLRLPESARRALSRAKATDPHPELPDGSIAS